MFPSRIFFHTIRSMFLPTLYLLGQDVPEADVYHATATGYGGILGALGAWRKQRPFIVTEHGIYTREREEEILRARWIIPAFRQQWINMFYMLARCSYGRSDCVTALFQRYADIQTELGCLPVQTEGDRQRVRLERFAGVPPKQPNGYIDIVAIIRVHPTKDIKP